jgi:flavodoxin
MRGLVFYDSCDSNGAQVAEEIAEKIRSAGHEVTIINLPEEEAEKRRLAPETDFLVRWRSYPDEAPQPADRVVSAGRGGAAAKSLSRHKYVVRPIAVTSLCQSRSPRP